MGVQLIALGAQRLIRYAQQRAVGPPEAIALGGDGGTLHINRNRPAEVKAQGRGKVAQLLVAVVGGNHSAGAQPLFDLFALHTAHQLDDVVQRPLYFSDVGE